MAAMTLTLIIAALDYTGRGRRLLATYIGEDNSPTNPPPMGRQNVDLSTAFPPYAPQVGGGWGISLIGALVLPPFLKAGSQYDTTQSVGVPASQYAVCGGPCLTV